MCCFLSCFVGVLTCVQRALTLILGGLMCFIVCVGVFTAMAVGVAYGYHYSKSEYLTMKKGEQNPTLIVRRTVLQGKDFTNDLSDPVLQQQGHDEPTRTFDWNEEQVLRPRTQLGNSPMRIKEKEEDMTKKNSSLQQIIIILNDTKSVSPKRYPDKTTELRRNKEEENLLRESTLKYNPYIINKLYDIIKVKSNTSMFESKPSNRKQLPYAPYQAPNNANFFKQQLSSLQPTIHLISQRRPFGKSLRITAPTTEQPTDPEDDDDEDEDYDGDEEINFKPV